MPGTVLESVHSSEHYLQIPPLRGINTLTLETYPNHSYGNVSTHSPIAR